MFGANEIVGKKFFASPQPSSLLVTSMFLTLQGEGPYAGRLAVFIRLAKCNLACSFCDTYFDAGDWLTFDQLEERIRKMAAEFYQQGGDLRKHTRETVGEFKFSRQVGLVVTGGEPLLQEHLVAFLDQVRPLFRWVQVESNGTIEQWLPIPVTLVVSPKCAQDADGKATRYLKPQKWMLARASCLKFIVREPLWEGDPYGDVPEWVPAWAATNDKPVYLSPMNVYNDAPAAAKAIRFVGKEAGAIPDLETRSVVDEVVSFWEPGLLDMVANERNHKHAARLCMRHGFRLNLQMHLYVGLA